MAYTAWSVVFGEQPTAAKWNQLGQNDAGFKDGTNFDDSIIDSRHYVDGSIDPEHLATNALLGNYTNSLGGSSTSTSFATATNGSLSVTVPSGGRSVMLIYYISVSTNALLDWRIRKDGSSVIAQGREVLDSTGGWTNTVSAIALDAAPSAGSHTYTFEFARATGTGTVTIGGGSFVAIII